MFLKNTVFHRPSGRRAHERRGLLCVRGVLRDERGRHRRGRDRRRLEQRDHRRQPGRGDQVSSHGQRRNAAFLCLQRCLSSLRHCLSVSFPSMPARPSRGFLKLVDGEALPLPCFSTAFEAVPLACVSTAFEAVPSLAVLRCDAARLPHPCVRRRGRGRADCSRHWQPHRRDDRATLCLAVGLFLSCR